MERIHLSAQLNLLTVCRIRSELLKPTAGKTGIQSHLSPAPLTAAVSNSTTVQVVKAHVGTSEEERMWHEQREAEFTREWHRAFLICLRICHLVLQKTQIKEWDFSNKRTCKKQKAATQISQQLEKTVSEGIEGRGGKVKKTILLMENSEVIVY